MTIRKGQEWGRVSTVPPGTVVAGSDAAVAEAWEANLVPLLSGGNLHSSLGNPAPKSTGQECLLLPVDALEVTVTDGGGTRTSVAASDVVVGRWARGDFVLVSANGRWAGLDIAPRAHPNDGSLHTLSIPRGVRLRQRLAARRRAVLGTHVPHPEITVTRSETFVVTRTGRQLLVVDGREAGTWETVTVRILPDHAEVLA